MPARHLLLLVLLLALGASACAQSGQHSRATAADDRFLSRYVTGDGRVIRHDQGDDIVSEGQAYAMLVAEASGQPARVRTIWSWTREHLGRPDGLIAWHAAGSGQVEDPHSATDADILIAYALLRYSGSSEAALHRDGRRIADAILANESVPLADGSPLLVAGSWATTPPATVNPSYLMPGVFDALGRLTGDQRWMKARAASVAALDQLTHGGERLPPDWAIASGDRLVATPRPGGGTGIEYGADAQRTPVWFATACDPGARRLAARWWVNGLESGRHSSAPALKLDGAPAASGSSPLSLLASAAAATAAGDGAAAQRLQARAEALARRAPTYYGDAWAALAPALLDDSINPCQDG